MECYIGCSGWFYYHWKGRFYPEELAQSKWFCHYTKNFNTVELNSCFYRFPKISTAKSWYRQSPKGFVYTLKVNRLITHVKKFKGCKKLIEDFYRIGEEIKEKVGCFLFQLPPSLRYSKESLDRIISQLNTNKVNVIEFRHPSWFTPKVYDKLENNSIVFCTVSAPGLPEDFVKTAEDVYVRFHGKESWYAYNYSKGELEEWTKKIKSSKPKRAWIYFNNDANANAPFNALTLKKLI